MRAIPSHRNLQTSVNLLQEADFKSSIQTAMTDGELNKRAEAIRINLSLWRAQSDIALYQNQHETNQAQLQAAVQEQLRPHSGNLQLTITSSFG
jgi:hypothetical protein